MANVERQLDNLPGQSFLGETVLTADSFAYTDPIDGSVSENQGMRIAFESGSRFVLRLSGTGTVGATLRLYLEKYVPPTGDLGQDTQETLGDLRRIADEIAKINSTLKRKQPSIIS